MTPMSVEQCVSEGLSGLLKNRSRIVPGRLNRIMNALVPASLARKMEADLLGKRACQQVRICRPVIIPGRVNRIMNAVIPVATACRPMASMLAKTLGDGRYAATAVMVVRLIACPR
jgi:hypothetical protein